MEGGTPTSTKSQEQGDHVYATNTAFETSSPGTWGVEASRGFVRELTPSPTAGPPASAVAAASLFQTGVESSTTDVVVVTRPAPSLIEGLQPSTPRGLETRWKTLISNPVSAVIPLLGSGAVEERHPTFATTIETDDEESGSSIAAFDDLFADGATIADLILLG